MRLDRVIAVRNSKTVFRDGDRCIKVFNTEYSKSDILSEALNHSIVEETGLLVPPVCEVTQISGKWAIVTSYIRGKTLSRMMEEEPEKETEYLQFFVNLHTGVHGTTCKKLRSLREKLEDRIAGLNMPEESRTQFLQKLSKTPQRYAVCHGDFDPSNVIVTEEGKAYVLDWSRAACGDGAIDAAGTYLQMQIHGRGKMAETYLKLYCKETGIDPSEILDWIPMLAVVQMDHSAGTEREQLKQWAVQGK